MEGQKEEMMTDASAAPAVAPKELGWDDFVFVACEVAKDNGDPSIISGLMELGPEYSLAKDEGVDSLGIIEAIMGIEEKLQAKFGSGFKVPDQLEERAKNIGEAYIRICEESSVQPDDDFSARPDFSQFKEWLATKTVA